MAEHAAARRTRPCPPPPHCRSYQSWGERVLPVAVMEPFTCREWVDLHSGALSSSPNPNPDPLTPTPTLTPPLTLILTLILILILNRRVLRLGAPLSPARRTHTPCAASRAYSAAHLRRPSPTTASQAVEDMRTVYPAPCIMHHAPCTMPPVPCTMHPTPCTVTPAPCKVVDYLRGLLDATAATLSAAERAKVEAVFLKAVDIEVAFFDNAYASA